MDSATQGEVKYTNDPSGWAARWAAELKAAHRATEGWRLDGIEAVHRYRDESRDGDAKRERRWNLFYSGVSMAQSLLFGQVPKIEVDRRFGDPWDDPARMAASMMQRILNSDLDTEDPYYLTLGLCLQDRLLPGLAVARVRHDAETEEVPADPHAALTPGPGEGLPSTVAASGMGGGHSMPGVVDAPQESMGGAGKQPLKPQIITRKVPGTEKAEVEYIHWQDFRWSPGARHWAEVTWVAFRVLMSRKQLVDRFGEEIGNKVNLNARQHDRDSNGKEQSTPWDRAEVWEIWDKESRSVYWYTQGHQETLGKEEDPLGLRGFFPCPRPMAANVVTDKYMPRPDYALAKDLYQQIDTLQTRLALLEQSLRIAGGYDKQFPELERLINGAMENELVPVDQWAALMEKGGIQGVMVLLPLEEIASTIVALEARQTRLKAQLDEVTGINDIVRGQGEAAATATHDRLMTRFSSARLRAIQEDFARFASDLAFLRAEVIARKFEPESIIAQANMADAPDGRLLAAAVALIKSPQLPYRIKVRPEALAIEDEGQTKAERMEVLNSITQFISTAMPIAQGAPQLTPLLLGLLQWTLASVRGAYEVEGLVDDAVAQIQQAQQQPPPQQPPPPPDPKLVLEQFRASAKERQIMLEAAARKDEILTQEAADNRREVVQREQNVLETLQELLIQRLIEQGWTPPGGMGPLPSAAPTTPVHPPQPPPPVPLMGG